MPITREEFDILAQNERSAPGVAWWEGPRRPLGRDCHAEPAMSAAKRKGAEARSAPRAAVDSPATVQCLADDGGITSFHASITDMSDGGIGFLVYAPDIHLAPGTILRGCRILVPGRAPVVADLEVRHSQRIATPDGGHALRSGCRIIHPKAGEDRRR